MTQIGEGISISVPFTMSDEIEELKCDYCDKKRHKFSSKKGNHAGNSTTLANRIFNGGKKKEDHPWYCGGRSIQAHHLVSAESMANDNKWPKLCRDFGYDINAKENGVMLPAKMSLACQIHAPLHRGPHDAGDADGVAYPDKVTDLIDPIKKDALSGNFCDDLDKLKKEVDAISKKLLAKVNKINYKITNDGSDYDNEGNGCSGVTSIVNKPSCKCPDNRKHSLRHSNSGIIIPKKSKPLAIGE